MPTQKPRAKSWTLEEYYRMAAAGLFRRQRVELIEGAVIQMPPQRNLHAIALGLAEQALRTAFGPGHWVRLQSPLHLGPRSAPEPDAAVVPGSPRTYLASGHPTTALLVVEVSDTTLAYDRGRKANLYARAGIADYWVVNLRSRVLEVRRSPVADPAQRYGHRYADLRTLTAADRVVPLAAPQAAVAVVDLLP